MFADVRRSFLGIPFEVNHVGLTRNLSIAPRADDSVSAPNPESNLDHRDSGLGGEPETQRRQRLNSVRHPVSLSPVHLARVTARVNGRIADLGRAMKLLPQPLKHDV